MKIYRRVIPKIAKDVIRSLLANRTIEIEDGHRDESEMDVAGVIVDYMNAQEQLKTDAVEALQRHQLTAEHLPRVKQSLAEARQLSQGDEAFDQLLDRLIEGLFNSNNIAEIYAEDHDIRKLIRDSVRKYLGVDEELDREVRGRLKNLREGTPEWEVEYGRLIDHMRAHRYG